MARCDKASRSIARNLALTSYPGADRGGGAGRAGRERAGAAAEGSEARNGIALQVLGGADLNLSLPVFFACKPSLTQSCLCHTWTSSAVQSQGLSPVIWRHRPTSNPVCRLPGIGTVHPPG